MLERFFNPSTLEEIASSLAELEAQRPAATSAAWSSGRRGGRASSWTRLLLPWPRVHPAAPALWARATGTSAEALRALLSTRAYLEEGGALHLWPWYPEEDETARTAALAESGHTGLPLPPRHLDEPFDAVWYLQRSGLGALTRWLTARGVTDPAAGLIDRIPVPPLATLKATRYEGGLSAEPVVMQRVRTLLRWVERAPEIEPEHRPELERRVDAALARLVAAMGGPAGGEAREPRSMTLPQRFQPPEPGEQLLELCSWQGGAVLATAGRLLVLDERGGLRCSVGRPLHSALFVAGRGAVVGDHLLDLSTGRWREGDLATLAAELGIPDVDEPGGSHRHTPARSACGLYGLDTDETPFIERLADGVMVAEGSQLDRHFGDRDSPGRGRGLLAQQDIEVGQTVRLGRVAFTLRNDEPRVADQGRFLAFALAGDRWRVLDGGVVRDGKRVVARVGVEVLLGAFTADGQVLWVATPDHLARLDLGEPPQVDALIPLAPLLGP